MTDFLKQLGSFKDKLSYKYDRRKARALRNRLFIKRMKG